MPLPCPCTCSLLQRHRGLVSSCQLLGALCLLVLLSGDWGVAPAPALARQLRDHSPQRPLPLRSARSAPRAAPTNSSHSAGPVAAADKSALLRRRRKRSPTGYSLPDMGAASGGAPSVEDTGLEFMVANNQQQVHFRPSSLPPQLQLAQEAPLPVALPPRDDRYSGSGASGVSGWPYYAYDAGSAGQTEGIRSDGEENGSVLQPVKRSAMPAAASWDTGFGPDGLRAEDVAVALGRIQDEDADADWSAPQRQHRRSGVGHRMREWDGDAAQAAAPLALDVVGEPEPSLSDILRNLQSEEDENEAQKVHLDGREDSVPDYALFPRPQADEEDFDEASAMGGWRAKRLTVPSSRPSFAPSRPPLVRQDAVDIPDEQLSGQGAETSSGDEDDDESDGREGATGVVLYRQAAQLRRIKKSVEDLLQRNQEDQDALQVRRLMRSAYDAPDASDALYDSPGAGGTTLADLDEEFDARDEQGADTALSRDSIRLRKRNAAYQSAEPASPDSEDGQLDVDEDDDEEESQSKADVSAPLEMPSPETDDLQEAVAGRFRVCDMVHNRLFRQMLFTGKTLEVDECYVSCERRDGDRVFSHIFKLVDWPCGAKLEGRCDKQGECSAF